MKLAALIAAAGEPQHVSGMRDVEINDINIDSREVTAGDLFVALKGANVDGHDYVGRAIENGAVGVVVEDDLTHADVCVIRVEDTRAYLAKLARPFFGDPTASVPVIGITGTNGKTTTASMIEHLMTFNGRTVGVFGTLNIRWPGTEIETPNTTPESLNVQRFARRMVDAGVDAIVMEVSSHALETHRVDGVTFATTLFTNLSRDHLNFHGSMDDYFAAKSKLFSDFVSKQIVNIDDAHGKILSERFGALTFGADSESDVRIRDLEMAADGSTFRLGDGDPMHVSMIGRYNVENAVAAWLAAQSLFGDSVRFDGSFSVPGRMQRVADSVFVDYAHTPDALETILATARQVTDGRLIVVFGCGGDRDKGKRPEMGKVATERADVVWVTSDNPRTEDPVAIVNDILVGAPNAHVEVDRATAITAALAEKTERDLVVIAGKGHEPYQEIAGERRPFSDRNIVEQFYA